MPDASNILILIDSDPEHSPRPAEAIRVAAGLMSSDRIQITVCLCGRALQLLRSDAEDYPDGANYPDYLPLLRPRDAAEARLFYLEQAESPSSTALPQDVSEPGLAFRPLSPAALAALISQSRSTLRL